MKLALSSSILMLFLCPFFTFGQITIDENDNVGVGLGVTEGILSRFHAKESSGNLVALFERNNFKHFGLNVTNLGTIFTFDDTGYFQINAQHPDNQGSKLFAEYGTPVFRINKNGNVGIGTISPTSSLEIVGTTTLDNLNIDGNINFTSAQNKIIFPSNNSEIIFNGNNGTIRANGSNFKLVSNTDFIFDIDNDGNQSGTAHKFTANDSAIELMRIQENGRVGIGTSTPQVKLQIEDTDADSDVAFGIKSGNAARSIIEFGDINDRDAGIIEYDNDGNKFRFHTKASQKMVIESGGNVGIGIEDPTEKLEVDGKIKAHEIRLVNGNAEFSLKSNNVSGSLGTTTDHPLYLRTSGANRMTLLSGGNVGIGTSNPLQRLHVAGAIKIGNSATAEVGSIRYAQNQFQGYTNGGWVNLENTDGQYLDEATLSGNNLMLSLSGDNAATESIDLSGLLPEISSSSNGPPPSPKIGDFWLVDVGVSLIYDGSHWVTVSEDLWERNNVGDKIFFNDMDGKVGIGTDSPNTNLDIKSLAPILSISDNDNEVQNDQLLGSLDFTTEDNSKEGTGARLSAITEGDFGDMHMSFSTRDGGTTGVLTEKVRITDTGDMGIGVSSPTEKLQVDGGINVGSTTSNNDGTIQYTGTDFQGRKNGNWVSLTTFTEIDPTIPSQMNNQGKFLMTNGTTTSWADIDESLWTESGTNTYLTETMNNIAIGGTVANSKLHVHGNTRIEGSILLDGNSDIVLDPPTTGNFNVGWKSSYGGANYARGLATQTLYDKSSIWVSFGKTNPINDATGDSIDSGASVGVNTAQGAIHIREYIPTTFPDPRDNYGAFYVKNLKPHFKNSLGEDYDLTSDSNGIYDGSGSQYQNVTVSQGGFWTEFSGPSGYTRIDEERIDFVDGNGATGFIQATVSALNIGTNSDEDIRFKTGSNSSTKMVIEHTTGHVGIGITDPTSTLDILGDNTNSPINFRGQLAEINLSPNGRVFKMNSINSLHSDFLIEINDGINGSVDLKTTNQASIVFSTFDGTAQADAMSIKNGHVTIENVLRTGKMTTMERDAISSPEEGMLIYNITEHKLQVYVEDTTNAWVDLH